MKMKHGMILVTSILILGIFLMCVSLGKMGYGMKVNSKHIQTTVNAKTKKSSATEEYIKCKTLKKDTKKENKWQQNQGNLPFAQCKSAKKAFEKATENLLGVDYEPVVLLGTKKENGVKYCILCRATEVYPDAESEFAYMYITQDEENHYSIDDIISMNF